MVIIEKLKYLNLEISTGKPINTKEDINIRCRLNSSEEHSWHSSNSQLNLIVDLIHNFYINWRKRQDDLEIKFENLYKEHKQLEEQYRLLNNKINLILKFLDESKAKQNLYSQNCEYIKEEITRFAQRIDSLRGKLNTKMCDKEIVLSSSGLVITSRTIISEKWTYLRALPEIAGDSS
jgi:predicted  nucleic acid-binding Zn-ribbon protein